MEFEWDPEKAEVNADKHSVTFEEAQTVFDDPLAVIYSDPVHSIEENRFLAIGESVQYRALVVAFTERDDNIRIISARVATARERKAYEEGE